MKLFVTQSFAVPCYSVYYSTQETLQEEDCMVKKLAISLFRQMLLGRSSEGG